MTTFMRLFALFSMVFCLMNSNTIQAQILPKNDLYLEDNLFRSLGISETEFNQTIDQVSRFYGPIIQSHGATLSVSRGWDDSTVNASAMQMGSTWYVNMYGGLARRQEVTQDAFVLVMCHEVG